MNVRDLSGLVWSLLNDSPQPSERFVIEARVGGGAAGDIYRCIDQLTGEPVALKLLHVTATESERARKRLNRMARVLKAAGIPMHVWTDDALPSPEAAREMILPKPAKAAATPAAPPVVDTRVRPSAPTPFDEFDRDESTDERIEMREPPPSTWFDEFNSGPAPLAPGDADPKRTR